MVSTIWYAQPHFSVNHRDFRVHKNKKGYLSLGLLGALFSLFPHRSFVVNMALISGSLLCIFLHFLVSALAGIIPNFNQIILEDSIPDINEATLPGALGNAQYDAIIVGGGPAGLSALSGLARVERTALLFDSGDYRNGPTRNMHDVIGNDGKISRLLWILYNI